MDVALEHMQGLQGQHDGLFGAQGAAPHRRARPCCHHGGQPGATVLGEAGLALPVIEGKILVRRQLAGHLDGLPVEGFRLGTLSGRRDDQWRTCLIHKDAVGLIDDGELQPVQEMARRVAAHRVDGQTQRLHALAQRQAIAQIVEDDGGEKRCELVPVAAGQVVVHRDDMHPHPRQGRRRRGQGGGQRLALPGVHLGDVAVQEHVGPFNLGAKVGLAQQTPRCQTDLRKGPRHQPVVVETIAAQGALQLAQLGLTFGR